MTEQAETKTRFADLFLKEKSYFLSRREVNWGRVRKCAGIAVGVGVLVVLLLPNPEVERSEFHERVDAAGATRSGQVGSDPSLDALVQLEQAGSARRVRGSLDYLYAGGGGGPPSQVAGEDRGQSMILPRDGLDSTSQIPPGSRILIRLYEKAVVANQGVPVIGVVTRDYLYDDAVAIPQGSKIFGEISFDDGGDLAQISWRSIQMPDGRERSISAIGVGLDGQVGVAGKVRSEALRNAVGQTITKFIGAYAEGSMQRGPLGANDGGSENGWKNAIAATAKDRTEAWAGELQKEKRWIEVASGVEFYAVLTQKFSFRDPGAIYGK